MNRNDWKDLIAALFGIALFCMVVPVAIIFEHRKTVFAVLVGAALAWLLFRR